MGAINASSAASDKSVATTSGNAVKWIALLFLPLVVFSAISQAAGDYNSRLWMIKSLSNTSYLFGTMHVADADILRIPPRLDNIIQSTTLLALEVAMDDSSALAMRQNFYLPDNQRLRTIVGDVLYHKVMQAFIVRGYGGLEADRIKPWAVALMLSFPPSDAGVVLDKKLQQLYAAKNKVIVGLETLQEQTQYFDAMNESDQIEFLSETLGNLHESDADLRVMKRHYLRGDLSSLQEFVDDQARWIKNEAVKQLLVDLIVTRNGVMLERMQPVLRKGNALIAVGALHLPGEAGLIQLLRKKGYQVTPVFLN